MRDFDEAVCKQDPSIPKIRKHGPRRKDLENFPARCRHQSARSAAVSPSELDQIDYYCVELADRYVSEYLVISSGLLRNLQIKNLVSLAHTGQRSR